MLSQDSQFGRQLRYVIQLRLRYAVEVMFSSSRLCASRTVTYSTIPRRLQRSTVLIPVHTAFFWRNHFTEEHRLPRAATSDPVVAIG